MKLSTKAKYGLKAVYILAANYGEVTSLATLSKLIGVSGGYIEQLMRLLKKDGIVESVRGATGGYVLTKTPDKITVGQAMRSLEDNLELTDCTSKGTTCEVSHCETRKIWLKIQNAINTTLDNITLQNMLDDKRKEL